MHFASLFSLNVAATDRDKNRNFLKEPRAAPS